MRRLKLVGLGLAIGVLILLVGGGLYLWLQQRGGSYDVEGRVAGFGQNARTVIVEHERIPGYMDAMTMSFTAADSAALGGLRPGDAVGFRLHAGRDSAWITGVERLPDSAVAQHPAGAMSETQKVATSGGVTMLEEGDAVPPFRLTAQDGAPVRRSDYGGQVLVLTFFYTSCPLPNFCPLMSRNFAKVQEMLPPKFQDQVRLLSISFDPQNDTPPVLRDYAARYTDDLSNWTFATGTPQEIGRVTAQFGVFTKRSGDQIVHNLTTALIGPDGRIRRLWRGNDWKPQQVLQAVRRVVGEEGA